MTGMHVNAQKPFDVMCPFDTLYLDELESTETWVLLVFFMGARIRERLSQVNFYCSGGKFLRTQAKDESCDEASQAEGLDSICWLRLV